MVGMLRATFLQSKNLSLRIISRKGSDLSENPQRLHVETAMLQIYLEYCWYDIVQAWWRHQEFIFIAKYKSNTESKVAKSFVV